MLTHQRYWSAPQVVAAACVQATVGEEPVRAGPSRFDTVHTGYLQSQRTPALTAWALPGPQRLRGIAKPLDASASFTHSGAARRRTLEHVADTSFAIDGHWLEVRLGCAASISNQPKPIHQWARSHKGMVKPAQSEARVRILCCCCSRNASTADGRPGAPYLFSHPPSSKRQARR